MKYKRIGSLITACLLSAALITGCGGGSTATSTSGPDESAKNTAVTEESAEDTAVTEESEVAENADPAEAADSIDVPAAAIDCSFELDGKKYTLPVKPQELIAAGWIDYYDKLGGELGGVKDTQTIFVKNDKDGNIDAHINIWIYNNSGNTKKTSECMISGILFEQETLEKCSFALGNGLKPGDDPAAVSELMGTPYYTDDESDPGYYYYGESSETGQIRFSWNKDNPSKSYILIEYYPAAEVSTSEEVPEYLRKYKAPAAMGEDLDSGTFSLEGTLYQLPCPVSELLSNGWTMEFNDPVPAGNSEYLKITKNDSSLYVTLINYADYQTIPSNCAVCSIVGYNVEGSFPDLQLPEGVTFDLDRSTLESIMEGSPISFSPSEHDSDTLFHGSAAYSCNFTYDNQEDYLEEIQYSFLSGWPW